MIHSIKIFNGTFKLATRLDKAQVRDRKHPPCKLINKSRIGHSKVQEGQLGSSKPLRKQ